MADSPALVQTYQLYIDGNWVEPADGRYDDISPSTEAVIATAPDASVAQVGDAIAAARRAFDSGPWGTTSAEQRAACLNQLGEALSKHADDFFALSQTEWGCIANERIMQIDGAGFMSMHAAGLATQLTDQEVTGLSAGTTLLRHAPLGVVSVLTPWNFPHCLNVMKLNHALAAGNTVVLKPSPLTPLAGLALARIIDEHTDIPPGVVNVVTPSGVDAAKLLTTDPRIDMVSFTGSSVVGRQVMSAASDTMKRILLELGGKSASIVLDDTEVGLQHAVELADRGPLPDDLAVVGVGDVIEAARRRVAVLFLVRLEEMIGSVPLVRHERLCERVVEGRQVAGRLPRLRRQDDRRVEPDHVTAAADEGLPPLPLDVLFQLDAERAVVPC